MMGCNGLKWHGRVFRKPRPRREKMDLVCFPALGGLKDCEGVLCKSELIILHRGAASAFASNHLHSVLYVAFIVHVAMRL